MYEGGYQPCTPYTLLYWGNAGWPLGRIMLRWVTSLCYRRILEWSKVTGDQTVACWHEGQISAKHEACNLQKSFTIKDKATVASIGNIISHSMTGPNDICRETPLSKRPSVLGQSAPSRPCSRSPTSLRSMTTSPLLSVILTSALAAGL
jgi:hypothetical protein